MVGHWTSKLFEYFEAEQKRLQCTLEGGPCMVIGFKAPFALFRAIIDFFTLKDPPRKYERLSKTVDRVRKTSAILTSGSAAAAARRESRKESMQQQQQQQQHQRTSVVSIEVSSVAASSGGAGAMSSEAGETIRMQKWEINVH